MLLTATEDVPVSEDWLYEVKYDGYRCLLHWDLNGVRLISRNGNELTHLFPEITSFSERFSNFILPVLPIVLDGEICYLTNDYKSEFSIVQTRGKMRNGRCYTEECSNLPLSFYRF
ncbi:ATP-dependent DNA ligase [Streptomyces canarius]